MKRKIRSLISVLLVLVVILSGCAKSESVPKTEYYVNDYYGGSVASYEDASVVANHSNNNAKSDELNDTNISKIIVSANVSMESHNLDETLVSIKEYVDKYNGYIQSSSVSNHSYRGYDRYCEMTVRVPAESFDDFYTAAQQVGNVTDSSIKTDDITQQYYDTQSRLESLRMQEERVKEFYKQAKTISELLEIEQRLSEIQSEIAAKEVTMANYELLTSYSTVTFLIYEVTEYTPTEQGFFTQLWDVMKDSFFSFGEFLAELLFFLIYSFWYIVLIVAVILIVKFLNKKYHFLTFKKRNKRKEKLENETLE